ncbi:predicted protein [Paecilomyces variotii No. 5]|uniref:Membrane insertase YidC/Oxa/ALB C-terminal domain-containing protein n=1 Tax=Byssochlamys spectabilis (strain No. 5 / NBRC 109023) TaxID=1356009 RepID=V5G4F7_BYSSN|nr:predicted protein [Paecilomyces variotii No. 5]
MLGGTGLRAPGAVAGLARQRLTASSSHSRSISSFACRVPRGSARLAKGNGILTSSPSSRVTALPAFRTTSARFNSSSSAAPAAAAATTTNTTAADGTSALDSVDVTDPSAIDITQIPEHVGYLKEIGLDYGWGPSALIEYILEHIHIYTGLPWWASIAATGLLVRAALFKPTMSASDTSAKISNLKPVSTPLRTKMMQYARDGNNPEMMKARAELQELHDFHGVKPWKAFVPMLQIPIGYGCFRVVRGMAALPVPALALEQVGWLKDLTVSDPYFILPMITAGCMYLTFRKGGENGMNEFTKTTLGKAMLYGLPAITFTFMAFWPSALQIYFCTTGAFALCQAYLLNSPSFRKTFGLETPIPALQAGGAAPQAGGDNTPSRGLRLIYDAIEAEKAKAAKAMEEKPAANVSIIDRAINSVKEGSSKFRSEMQEKMNELSGQGPVTNADGTPAAPPRLSQKDMKMAEDYDKRRREEEEWKREERNHARREAHLRALEAEREKARRSWLKQSQQQSAAKAKNKQR